MNPLDSYSRKYGSVRATSILRADVPRLDKVRLLLSIEKDKKSTPQQAINFLLDLFDEIDKSQYMKFAK